MTLLPLSLRSWPAARERFGALVAKIDHPLFKKFDALSPRERATYFLITAALILFVFDFAVITPLAKNRNGLAQRIAAQGKELQKLRIDVSTANEERKNARPAPELALLEDMRRKIAEAKSLVEKLETAGMDPAVLVRTINEPGSAVHLLSFKVATPTLLGDAPAAVSDTPPAGAPAAAQGTPEKAPARSLFRQNLELSVQGNYLAVLALLEKLQASARGFSWGNMSMEVTEYPDSVFKFTLVTQTLGPSGAAP